MFAATQRRRFSVYLVVPFVVAIVPLLVAKLVALQRADVIAELADRVAHRDSREAAAAVRQLADMPWAPVSILVAAATSADREVAEQAKYCIGKMLRRGQRQLEAKRRVAAVARQLTALAESLAAERSAFSTADFPWLSNTTHKVLRLANRIPTRQTPLVAVHCDAVLAEIAAREVATKAIVENIPVVEQPFAADEVIVDDPGQSRQAYLEQELVSSSEQPADAATSKHTQVSERIGSQSAVEGSAEELWNSPWRASWSHPLFRMMPAQPIPAPAAGERPAEPVPLPRSPGLETPPDERNVTEPPLATLEARELLRRWLDAEGREIQPLEQELTRRKFGRLSERLVQPLFSGNPKDRLALVDDVLTEPGVDARPWLVLLSEDSDADVRLLAVTIMATSNDSSLVEQAWQVTIRDRDPRIAGLSERLRDRRGGAQRR